MSDNKPTTTFAGDSNPRAKQNYSWGFFLLAIIFAPVAVITTLTVYFLFSLVRIHYKVIGSFVLLYGVILTLSGNLVASMKLYASSFLELVPYIQEEEWGKLAWNLFISQAPFSLLIGGVVGYFFSWWRYKRRPVWIEDNFRRTPVQLFRRWKNINDIKKDKRTPPDGRTIGVNYEGDRITQTEAESVSHTLLVGGSGTGKTTTMCIGARDIIKRKEALLFVDMKGSSDIPVILAEYCKRYNRRFFHWTMQNPDKPYTGPAKLGPAYYDPLKRGDATRKADLLISLREWSEDYFKKSTKSYLQNALIIAGGNPEQDQNIDSLQEAMLLIDGQYLKKRCLPLVGNPRYEPIITAIHQSLDGTDGKETRRILGSMRDQLALLRNSTPGQWLRKDPTGQQDINLFDVAHNGDVVLFTVDSSTYEDTASDIGNLIIQDLKTVAGELMGNKARFPLNVFIDEFSAIGSDSISNLLARCREAGIPVTLSTQSLGDLREVSDAFLDKLTGIVSSFMIHRANSLKDAEVYAGFGSQEKKMTYRQNVEMRSGLFGGIGKGSSTGAGSLDESMDYIVSPSYIQELSQGELVFITNSPKKRIEYVTVIKEDDMKVSNDNDHSAPENDANWVASGDDYIPPMDKESIEEYTIDPTINPQYKDDAEVNNPFRDFKQHPSNKEALAKIFSRGADDSEVHDDAHSRPTATPQTAPRSHLRPREVSHQETKRENPKQVPSLPVRKQQAAPNKGAPVTPQRKNGNSLPPVPPRPQKPTPNSQKRPSAPSLPPRRTNPLPRPPKPSEDDSGYIADWD